MTEILILLGVIAVIGLIIIIIFSGVGFFIGITELIIFLISVPFIKVWYWWTNRK